MRRPAQNSGSARSAAYCSNSCRMFTIGRLEKATPNVMETGPSVIANPNIPDPMLTRLVFRLAVIERGPCAFQDIDDLSVYQRVFDCTGSVGHAIPVLLVQ